jgi:pimeloyl-ACP methyl ester carboxylesterase
VLDHLGVAEVAVLGHSTGGMTATRFTLMNPDRVTHLVLEDPFGLADYRIGIPPQSEETLYQHELNWTDPAVIRAYVAAYFVHPDPKIYELARSYSRRSSQSGSHQGIVLRGVRLFWLHQPQGHRSAEQLEGSALGGRRCGQQIELGGRLGGGDHGVAGQGGHMLEELSEASDIFAI